MNMQIKQKLGVVLETFSAKKGQSGFPRPRVEKLIMKQGFGIVDDKFAGKDEDRAVMIIGSNSYEMVKNHDGTILEYGAFGENILLDFDPHKFEVGEIIVIGDVKLQIKSKCSICNHLSVFGKHIPKLIKDYRGLYCKILSDGVVNSNDIITKD